MANKPRPNLRVNQRTLSSARRWHQGSVIRSALLVTGLSLAPLVNGRVCGQTYAQVAELNPSHPIGARITSAVTNAQLSRTLFGRLGTKITLINATDYSPPVAYEFATDPAWNRLLFGQKDVYIHGFDNSGTGHTPLLGPAGIDVSSYALVHIADAVNSRVLLARFVSGGSCQGMYEVAVTPSDSALRSVIDVAWDGGPTPETFATDLFYALDGNGHVSYWNSQRDKLYIPPPCPGGYRWFPPVKQWTYGSAGSGTGQFRDPRGICAGHAIGANGTAAFTADFYVADAGNKRLVWLQRTTSGANWMGSVLLPNAGVPVDCTVDEFGNVTVADPYNSKLVKYTWNLQFLDSYGSYGVGATNDNTLAHPHAVHVPYGTMYNAANQVIWYGEGRVLTGEDWGTQSGAREHYLGISGSITTQPNTNAQFTYFVTDHGSQVVTVVNSGGTAVRTLVNDALDPPGARTLSWDGNTSQGLLAPTGNYTFKVVATSAYGCSGQPWCSKNLATGSFFHQGPPPPSVSISGPATVQPGARCLWSANASGGTPPYHYAWTPPGNDSPDLTYTNSGQNFTVSVRVTDAVGASGNDSYPVTVSSNARACLF